MFGRLHRPHRMILTIDVPCSRCRLMLFIPDDFVIVRHKGSSGCNSSLEPGFYCSQVSHCACLFYLCVEHLLLLLLISYDCLNDLNLKNSSTKMLFILRRISLNSIDWMVVVLLKTTLIAVKSTASRINQMIRSINGTVCLTN